MKFCLDRFEGNFAVCLCEDADAPRKQYDFALDAHPALKALAEGTLFEAVVDEAGNACDIRPLLEETEARRAAAQSRLHALFARSKKKQ